MFPIHMKYGWWEDDSILQTSVSGLFLVIALPVIRR